MRRILLDTTGIYYAANAMKKIEDTHGLYSELSKSEYDALFNVVSAIVLWDEFGTIEGGFGAPKPSYSLNGMYYFNKYEKSFSVVDRELVVHPQSESKEIVEFVEEKDEEWTVAGQPEELNELFETLTADWKVEERVKWCLRSFEARRALSYLLIANKNDKAGFTLEAAKEMVKDQIEIDFSQGREPLEYDPQLFYEVIREFIEQDAEDGE